jgi:NodT family efflux transporter outer membrane factor (OMF) lipoprotein
MRGWSALALCAALAGCKVGPNYKTPAAVMAPTNTYKEAPPVTLTDGWTTTAPADAQLKGDWWTMFNDTQLNELEPQVDTANQTLKAAEATFRAARAQVGYSRSFESPTIGVAPFAGATRDSANQPYFNVLAANNGEGNFSLPLDFNYELDVWGKVRRGVTQARNNAQAADADLETARLSLHAELALDYFRLRSDDAQVKLYNDTIKAYQRAYELTEARFEGGVAPQSDVTQAQTQLEAAQVQRTDLGIDRASQEHAIAVLTGKPPSELTIAPTTELATPSLPHIPGVLPSVLLQRRPDVAANERRMAAANEAIGIAQAAYYPDFSLSATGGFLGTSLVNWFSWPSRFFALGPTISETVFDAGRRRSTKEMTAAQYDETVANYRQSALTAFQQVEDSLAALRILSNEAEEQHAATASAEKSLELFNYRYEGGVDTYLQVITWQTQALNNERNDIVIAQRRLESSVLLVKALGGGWNAASIPHL